MARTPRQAVVVIHGMGQQLPMSMLRRVAAAAIPPPPPGLPPYYSKPDRMSSSFELRRLRVPAREGAALPETDFYEFYWAHHMEGNRLGQLAPLLKGFMLRWPWQVPGSLALLYTLLWIVAGGAASAALLFTSDWAVAGGASPFQQVGKWVSLGVTAASLFLQRAVTGTFVDVARYLHPEPRNVAVRQTIRAEAVELLRRLHARGDYDRIVVVGHSLGSVIGMEAITYLWSELHATGRDVTAPKPPAMAAFEATAGALLDAAAAADRDEAAAAALERARAAYRAAQTDLWLALVAEGNAWRISDFVSVGSPLAHAALLLARPRRSLAAQRADRDLPSCPPTPEASPRGRDRGYVASYTIRGSEGRPHPPRRVLHDGAAFGPTRWTNLWFPPHGGLFGDNFAGPVGRAFGPGVVDRPITAGPWRRLLPVLPHMHYFDGFTRAPDDRPGTAVHHLRAALDLADRRLVARARSSRAARIDLNVADEAVLARLPGIGPERAARIVDHRARRPFHAVAELAGVPGVPAAVAARIAREGLAVAGRTAGRRA